MEYAILSIILGLCLFLIPLWTYRKGLQDGLNISSLYINSEVKPYTNNVIQPIIKNPITAVKEYKEQKEEEKQVDTMLEGLQNILSYTGDSQLNERS